jgi:ribonuclease P protein component
MQVIKLKKRREYLQLGSNCKRLPLPAFVVLSQEILEEENVVRIGFTASKKVGNAVARNLAKRRMRAVFDQVVRQNDQFEILDKKGLIMNFVARPYILNRDFSKLIREMSHLLKNELNCKV